MGLTLDYLKHLLRFKFDARTSRGTIATKPTWIIKVYHPHHPGIYGLGEVSRIEGLSPDAHVEAERMFDKIKTELNASPTFTPTHEQEVYRFVQALVPVGLPSFRFGLETALLDLLHGGARQIFDSTFYRAQAGIPINGLIWMGSEAWMKNQIDQKLRQGFRCIKMKVGALNFRTECRLLHDLRSRYAADELIIRVDANGAFSAQEAPGKLAQLAAFDLHSIEQPIMPGQTDAMRALVQKSPIPIALDEELIGVSGLEEKQRLLATLHPAYLILKPSLLGGFWSTAEWIHCAEDLGIPWWVTSALESNIGLNAICQFTAQYKPLSHQGLGTGHLYHNNFTSPLYIASEHIKYHPSLSWDLPVFKGP